MPDKVLTVQHANSVIDEVSFRFDASGNVVGVAHGRTTYASGGNYTSVQEAVLPNGQLKTDAIAIRARALTFWKTQEGL
jgi:hypothetical protein